jgi:hypothetical protein
MTTDDVRRVLHRLGAYEDACFDENGKEVVDVHAIHLLRGQLASQADAAWILCSEALPTDTKKPYDITAEIELFGKKILATDVLRYRGDGLWEQFEGADGMDYKIIAWKERPKPWNAEVPYETTDL